MSSHAVNKHNPRDCEDNLEIHRSFHPRGCSLFRERERADEPRRIAGVGFVEVEESTSEKRRKMKSKKMKTGRREKNNWKIARGTSHASDRDIARTVMPCRAVCTRGPRLFNLAARVFSASNVPIYREFREVVSCLRASPQNEQTSSSRLGSLCIINGNEEET